MANNDKSTPALDRQIGGDHYKHCAIQPVEFSLANGLNAAQHSIVKYLQREKADTDLGKAAHFCELWVALFDADRVITVKEYAAANNLSEKIEDILELIIINPTTARIERAQKLIEAMDARRRR